MMRVTKLKNNKNTLLLLGYYASYILDVRGERMLLTHATLIVVYMTQRLYNRVE